TCVSRWATHRRWLGCCSCSCSGSRFFIGGTVATASPDDVSPWFNFFPALPPRAPWRDDAAAPCVYGCDRVGRTRTGDAVCEVVSRSYRATGVALGKLCRGESSDSVRTLLRQQSRRRVGGHGWSRGDERVRGLRLRATRMARARY